MIDEELECKIFVLSGDDIKFFIIIFPSQNGPIVPETVKTTTVYK